MNQRLLPLSITSSELFSGELAERIPYYRMHGKPYCLNALAIYSSAEASELQAAAEAADRICQKALRFAQRYLPDTFLTGKLGIPPALLPLVREEHPWLGITRQDWIVHPQHGMKCIEFNTDTPTGIPESAYLTGAVLSQAAGAEHYRNPSANMDACIQAAATEMIEYCRRNGNVSSVAFTSYGWHEEDVTNIRYIQKLAADAGVQSKYIPLEKLEIVPEEGLYAESRRIEILYRLYPLEYLIQDCDGEGFPIGEKLLELVQSGKLQLINPAQSCLAQSKGLMALIWSLYEHRTAAKEHIGAEVLSEEDLGAIERYFLPTYYSSDPFVQENIPYVAKAYWGREGKGTVLYGASGSPEAVDWGSDEALEEEMKMYYGSQPMIYQKRVEMEAVTLEDEEGHIEGRLLTGVFVIAGQYAGLLPRIGGLITGDQPTSPPLL